MLVYTNIQHEFRRAQKLSCNEYVLCDMVFFLSNFSGSKVPGWCYMTKEQIAEELGLTKQGILKMVERLIEEGFLVKNEQTKYLQTSFKWQKVYYTYGKQSLPTDVIQLTPGKESLPESSKLSLPGDGKQSLPEAGKQSLPNNTTLNNNTDNNKKKAKAPSPAEDIKERKTAFFKAVDKFKSHNKGKYPDLLYEKFFVYWTEVNELEGGQIMRFEDKKKYKFFEIGKRLATFWARVEAPERSLMWKQQEAKEPIPQGQLNFGEVLKTNSEEWK